MILANLFFSLEKAFILINIWVKGASLMKHHCLKKDFYSNLSIEDIIDSEYNHTKRACKDFEIKKFSENHALYLKSNVLLLADVFEKFRKMFS